MFDVSSIGSTRIHAATCTPLGPPAERCAERGAECVCGERRIRGRWWSEQATSRQLLGRSREIQKTATRAMRWVFEVGEGGGGPPMTKESLIFRRQYSNSRSTRRAQTIRAARWRRRAQGDREGEGRPATSMCFTSISAASNFGFAAAQQARDQDGDAIPRSLVTTRRRSPESRHLIAGRDESEPSPADSRFSGPAERLRA